MTAVNRDQEPNPRPGRPLGERLLLVPTHASRRPGVFPLGHPYLEQCWLPVLGPSSVVLLRRTADLWLEATPAVVDPADLSVSLGLGQGVGANSRLHSTIERLGRFGFATWSGPETLDVAYSVPMLSPTQLSRVSPWVRGRHDLHVAKLTAALESATAGPGAEVESSPAVAAGGSASMSAARLRARARCDGSPSLSL